jgi:hypothetical protein
VPEVTAPAYDGTLLPDELFVLAGTNPAACYLLSEAEEAKEWAPDYLRYLPSTVSPFYAKWLWTELVWAVADLQGNPDATVREAELYQANIRSLLVRLLSGATPCWICCQILTVPFADLLASSVCGRASHRQDDLRLVRGAA